MFVNLIHLHGNVAHRITSHRLEPDVILEASHGVTDVILLAGELFAIPGYRDYLACHMFLVVGITGTHDQLNGVVRIGKNLEMYVGRHAERTSAFGHVGELGELDELAGILGTSLNIEKYSNVVNDLF